MAAADYSYDAATNQYTVVQTSGDVTAVLQTILKEATDNCNIKILPGSYTLGSVSYLGKNFRLEATGATFSLASGSQEFFRFPEPQTGKVVFTGGVYDGNKQARWMLNLFKGEGHTQEVVLDGVELKNAATSGVRISVADRIFIKNVKVSNCGYGLDIKNSSNVLIENCTISNCVVGIDARVLDGENTILDTQVTKSSQVALQIKNGGAVVGKNLKINNNVAGVSLTSGSELTLYDSEVCDNTSNGVSPVGTKGKKTAFSAYRCKFDRNGRHGVAADTYLTVAIEDCQANGNAVNGFTLNHFCDTKKFVNCTANNNKGNGFFVQNSSICDSIEKCEANGNGIAGFALEDCSTKVSDCVANENKKNGIAFGGNKKFTVSVKNCEASKNGGIGFVFREKKIGSATGIIANENATAAVQSYASTLTISGKSNTFLNNKKHGLDCRAGKMYVSGATVSGCKQFAVYYAGSSAGGYCVNSTLTNSLGGIAINEGANVSKATGNKIGKMSKAAIIVYDTGKGKSSKLGALKKNQLDTTSKMRILLVTNRGRLPKGVKDIGTLGLDTKIKANVSTISGTAYPNVRITVTVNKKKIVKKASSNGKFTITIPSLKKKDKLTIQCKDKFGNQYLQRIKV